MLGADLRRSLNESADQGLAGDNVDLPRNAVGESMHLDPAVEGKDSFRLSPRHPQTVMNIGNRLFLGERVQPVADADSLPELAELRLLELALELGLADEGDLEFKEGSYRVTGTDKQIKLTDVAKASYAPMGPLTQKFGIGLESTGSFDPTPPSHPNGAHVCEVEVDPETGAVAIDRYYVVDDLGRILNPMIVLGQQQGGVVQGVGQALM